MKLIVTEKEFKQMPYHDTEVKKSKTYGEIVGLLEEYGIKDYDWKKRKPVPPFTVGEDALVFPLEFKGLDGSNHSAIVRIEVPQIYVEKKDRGKVIQVYKEEVSWRLMWWYIKARVEAAFFHISTMEQEFLYQITDEGTGTRLGDRLVEAIKRRGVDGIALEDRRDRREVEVEGEVKEVI